MKMRDYYSINKLFGFLELRQLEGSVVSLRQCCWRSVVRWLLLRSGVAVWRVLCLLCCVVTVTDLSFPRHQHVTCLSHACRVQVMWNTKLLAKGKRVNREFAFISYTTPEEAGVAIRHMHGRYIEGITKDKDGLTVQYEAQGVAKPSQLAQAAALQQLGAAAVLQQQQSAAAAAAQQQLLLQQFQQQQQQQGALQLLYQQQQQQQQQGQLALLDLLQQQQQQQQGGALMGLGSPGLGGYGGPSTSPSGTNLPPGQLPGAPGR
jgi:hypothetical protein